MSSAGSSHFSAHLPHIQIHPSACEQQQNAQKTQGELWRCGEQVAGVQVPSIMAGKMLRVTTVLVPTVAFDMPERVTADQPLRFEAATQQVLRQGETDSTS